MEHCIAPVEDIVVATAPKLRQQVELAIASGASLLRLDLRQVEFVDSVGLSVIIGASMSMQRAGGVLEVFNARPDVRDLFHTMRLDDHFAVLPLPGAP